ncbi:MAG TPA: AAA family ATPase [Oligoflexia bacterium]|nr:AAA family ATPase [Oligoflexia bacterium]HMP48938.1 AAA family ATPase [Oligoflexia bacterium]
MLARDSQVIISKLLRNSSRDVIIVEGARQVGKTTLVQSCLEDFPSHISINLETDLKTLKAIDQTESFSDFEIYLKNSFGLKDAKGEVIFIDEAQESEKLGGYLRSFKEKWKHVKVILSGSSMTRLFRENQRIPVGRYTSILITPLTFQEFLEARQKHALVEIVLKFSKDPSPDLISKMTHQAFLEELDVYLEVGGLPAVVNDYLNAEDWKRRRIDILLSQEEDFVRKSNITQKQLFNAGLKGVANNLGGPAKYTHISEKFAEAKKVVDALIAWKLIYEIEQKGNATTSSFFPKRYIYDVGIAHELRSHPFPKISILNTLSSQLRTPLGGLIENALLLQLIGDPGVYSISGWKNSSDENKEIDFVIQSTLSIPAECKSSLKYSERNFYGLMQYLEISKQNSGILINLSPFKIKTLNEKKLINLPFYLARLDIMKNLLS